MPWGPRWPIMPIESMQTEVCVPSVNTDAEMTSWYVCVGIIMNSSTGQKVCKYVGGAVTRSQCVE